MKAQGASDRGYELEDWVLGCFLHEPRHRVVALGIEERSSYWHFSDVALKDRPRRFGSDLLGMHFLSSVASPERYFGQGAHIGTQLTFPYGETSHRSAPISTRVTGVVLF